MHHDRRQPGLERLLEDEARLGQRPLGGVDQEQHAVDHRQRALDLAAEVGVARGVDDVDVDAAVVDGGVLGQDGDAALALEVDGVHDPLAPTALSRKMPALLQHGVDQGGLAVVDVGDDGNVADVLALLHQPIVPRDSAGAAGLAARVGGIAMRMGGAEEVLMRHRVIEMVLLMTIALGAISLTGPAVAQEKAKGAVITLQKGGEIQIEFFPDDAPKTVENFVKLASRDSLTAGCIAWSPDSSSETGDPQSKTLKPGDPKLGTGGPGYTIKAEFNKRPHERGAIAMARTQDPDSAGSQFYITLAPANFLDGKYTVFGKVVSGMSAVDSIKVGDRIASIKIIK